MVCDSVYNIQDSFNMINKNNSIHNKTSRAKQSQSLHRTAGINNEQTEMFQDIA